MCPDCNTGTCRTCKERLQVHIDPGRPCGDKAAIAFRQGHELKHVHTFGDGEVPGKMLVFNDVLYVATSRAVYFLNSAGKLEQVGFVGADEHRGNKTPADN